METFNYNDGGRKESGLKGKAGDCVCRAIAIATGMPYNKIWQELSKGNASQRKGKYESKTKVGKKTADKGISTKRKWFDDYMKSMGFKWIPTMLVGQGCKIHLKKEELPMGTIICNVSKHFVAVIDGVINDTYDCSRGGTRCVYGYYIKEK